MGTDRTWAACPDTPFCQTCPAADEDDVCLEHERDLHRRFYELEIRLREAEAERDRYLEIASEQREKWNFDTLMFVAEKLLEVWYPPDIIPTADADRRDPGPRLVSALRACIEARGDRARGVLEKGDTGA